MGRNPKDGLKPQGPERHSPYKPMLGLCRRETLEWGKGCPLLQPEVGIGSWGLQGAAGTRLQASYMQFPSLSPSLATGWETKPPLSSAFRPRASKIHASEEQAVHSSGSSS